MTDPVNHPAHYNNGPIEAIDVMEQAIASAPDPVLGALHWSTLKYLLRLWLKNDDALTDARKAQWYLNRLINKLEAQ